MSKFEKTHGLYGTRIYRIHHNMKQRCYNPNNTAWNLYGGKGIEMCDEWLGQTGFINFYNWAINNGYDNTLSIDRIDPNGNYEPSNCRWVDQKFQCNNRNDNRYLEYKGYNFTISIWSEITKIKDSTINARLRKNWSIEDTLRTPVGNKRGQGYLCWEITPEYIKYHNPDLNREQMHAKRRPLSEETKQKLSNANRGKPNYNCRGFTVDQIYNIYDLKYEKKYSNRQIAREYRVHHDVIGRIFRGRTYSNILNAIQNGVAIAA